MQEQSFMLNTVLITKTNLPIAKVPSTDKFLSDFCKLYQSNPKIKDSLLVCLMKSIVCKMSGQINPKYHANVFNFYMAMYASGNKTLFNYVSGNLLGPSLRHMRRAYASIPSTPFINLSHNEIVNKVEAMIRHIKEGVGDRCISFSVGVDATVVAKSWQLSSKHQAILGGGYPNHFLCIKNKDDEEIHQLLDEL